MKFGPALATYCVLIASMIIGFAVARNFKNSFGLLFVAMMAVTLNFVMLMITKSFWGRRLNFKLLIHAAAMLAATVLAIGLEQVVRLINAEWQLQQPIGYGGAIMPSVLAFFILPTVVNCAFGFANKAPPNSQIVHNYKLVSKGWNWIISFEFVQLVLAVCSAVVLAALCMVERFNCNEFTSSDSFYIWFCFVISGALHLYFAFVVFVTGRLFSLVRNVGVRSVLEGQLVWFVLTLAAFGILALFCFLPEAEDGALRSGELVAGGFKYCVMIFAIWGLLPALSRPMLFHKGQH